MLSYDRHMPEKTPYYQALARCWPGVVRDFNAADEKISGHVLSEFNRYFKCGILQHGFVWLKCNKCEDERIVAYSCKTKGLCFSCNARRMEQTAIRIDEEVWPNAPIKTLYRVFWLVNTAAALNVPKLTGNFLVPIHRIQVPLNRLMIMISGHQIVENKIFRSAQDDRR